MHALLAMTPLLLALQTQAPAPCPPCASGEAAAEIGARLEEAFAIAIVTKDCSGESGLASCRQIERLLSESFEKLRPLVHDQEAAGAIDCLACDPGPYLTPLFGGFESVVGLLLAKSYDEFEGTARAMAQDLDLWKAYRCCGTDAGPARPSRNREMDARAVLQEKCGASFESSRQGLRQIVRMPGDRSGCYQSRACRSAAEHNGAFIEAGFWTYDGEYWYIWAERRTPDGRWVECDP